MDRIRYAVERLRTEPHGRGALLSYRGQHDTHPSTDSPVERVAYTRTRNVEPSLSLMREKLVLLADQPGYYADLYKILRTQVLQRMRERSWSTLAVTSPGRGEGKSLTAINLAISIAQEVDSTVLLVDTDLREPRLHTFFGIDAEPGLSDYLVADLPLEHILVHPLIDRFVILPGGRPLLNSSELLGSKRMAELVVELKTRYRSRYVIFDLPPTLTSADALAFAPCTDAILLVVEDGRTHKEDVLRAAHLLHNTPLIGTVLNKAYDAGIPRHDTPPTARDAPQAYVGAVASTKHGSLSDLDGVYERFFGFNAKPFSIDPDPSFLFFSRQHGSALDMVAHGLLNLAGFTAITGDTGTGKTTLIRFILNNIDRNVSVGVIWNTHSGFGELLQWILSAFSLNHSGKGKVELLEEFTDFVSREYAANRKVVLVVDEAQNLSTDMLEELRMLSNVCANNTGRLQIILVGHVGLRERLRSPELEQFAQRIAVDFHLEPLDLPETRDYIHHRLWTAGSTDLELFDDEACEAVYRHSGGVPRLVNLLCDTALVYAYGEGRQTVNAPIIESVASDKARGGMFRSALQPYEAAESIALQAGSSATTMLTSVEESKQ